MGCGCNKKNRNSNSLKSSFSGNCPNKRLQLNNLKQLAKSKSNTVISEDSKLGLSNIVLDIDNYLSNESVCPQSSYISAIKQTINGFK